MRTTDHPTLQKFQIEGVKHINPAEAMDMLEKNNAILIDVREEDELQYESIPLDNVLYHPMSVILDRLSYISKEQNIILGCPGGVRSSKVANLLTLQGYPHVANLDGGFTEWKAQGLPMKTNLAFSTGCGCGCSATTSEDNKGTCC